MASYKVVDADQLDAGMTATADAIRAKTGSADAVPWDSERGFADAVEGIEAGGEEIFFSPYGVGYVADTVLDSAKIVGGAWLNANELKSLELTEWNPTGAADLKSVNNASLIDTFQSTSLETLLLPKLQYGGHYWARYARGLKTVQLGSIGYPVSGGLASLIFTGCTQSDVTIAVYVDADTLADIPTGVSGSAPWGATNATIVYRNSTTGEVLTE